MAVLASGKCSICNLGTQNCARVLVTCAQLYPSLPLQYSLTLSLLHCYVDAIFVLPDLGTGQGMSTLSGDQKIIANFPSFDIEYGSKCGKDLI